MASVLSRQIKTGRQRLRVLAQDRAMQSPTAYMDERRLLLDSLHRRLIAGTQQITGTKRQKFIRMTASLDAMSPLKVLTRGYSLTTLDSGKLLTSSQQVAPGDRLKISLADGSVHATVTKTEVEP